MKRFLQLRIIIHPKLPKLKITKNDNLGTNKKEL